MYVNPIVPNLKNLTVMLNSAHLLTLYLINLEEFCSSSSLVYTSKSISIYVFLNMGYVLYLSLLKNEKTKICPYLASNNFDRV